MSFSREKEIQTLLQQALKFTGDDLQANRTDKLSDSQKEALRSERFWTIIGYILICTMLATLILHPANFTVLMIIMLFLTPLVAVPSLRVHYRVDKAIEYGKTETVTGIVRRSIDFHYRRRHRSKAKYQILIGDRCFDVPKNVHDAFVESEVYTVYFIPNMKRIVSGEMGVRSRNIVQSKIRERAIF